MVEQYYRADDKCVLICCKSYYRYCYSQCGSVHVELSTSVLSVQEVGKVKVQVVEFWPSV